MAMAGLGGYGRGREIVGSASGCRTCGRTGHFARECPQGRIPGGLQQENNNIGNNRGDGSAAAAVVVDDGDRMSFMRVQRQAVGQHFIANGDGGEDSRRPPVTYTPLESNLNELWTHHIKPGINFDRLYTAEVSGNDPSIVALATFESAQFKPLLFENVKRAGFDKPTPIQQYAIPVITRGKDLMACACTGSGKTGAYLLPILSVLLKNGVHRIPSERQEPNVIIIVPTRELAIQVKDEARKFAGGTSLGIVVAYGGTNVRAQADTLKTGCNVLVATPGRLMQWVDEGRIGLRSCRFLVLDEADRMLDMGFEPTMRKLIDSPEMPPKGDMRQTLMFSATFPTEIQNLAQDFLHQYVFITIGKLGGACEDITQEFLLVSQHEKHERLLKLLQDDLERAINAGNENAFKTLVFVERRRVADFVASRLSQMGLRSTSIHGDRQQREREEALRDFVVGRSSVLIATAVASRGLDILGVDHVINFDLPATADDYVHRIGRTGRVGNPGRATSFYDPGIDKVLARPLLQILRDARQTVPEYIEQDATRGDGGGGGGTEGFGGAVTTADDEQW